MALTEKQKLIASLYSALLFALLSSPMMYRVVNSLTSMVGLNIADKNGCPNMAGLVLHSLVFLGLTYLMMKVDLPGLKDEQNTTA